jgi:hypothetical protein
VARNRVGIGLSYRPARLHSLAEMVPWNRFLDSIKIKITGSALSGKLPPGGYKEMSSIFADQ